MARILTDLERILLNGLNSHIDRLRMGLQPLNINVYPVDIHLIDRINDRGFDPYDVADVLRTLHQDKLCEFIYGCEHTNKEHTQFGILHQDKFVLHGTYIKNEIKRVIKFRTVVKYFIGYHFDDFKLEVM